MINLTNPSNCDMATHKAEYISNNRKYDIPVGIISHSKTFGYPLYILKDFDTDAIYSIGMLRSDWHAFIGIKTFSDIKRAFLCENDQLIGDESYDFCCLTDQILEKIKEYKNTGNFNTYIFQNFLYPEKTIKVTKKLEFEIGYKLICKLNDLIIFKHQQNIMNYYADFLLELKNNLNRDIPSIVVEIDEDDHIQHDKIKEKNRKEVIEAFGNRIISISVNRNATEKEINSIVDNYAVQIRQLCKDLIIEYSPEIKDDDFIRIIEEHNIEKTFIQLFFKKSENTMVSSIFKYSHQEIGDFLGYSQTKNYNEFINNTIVSKFIEGKDYIICNKIFPGIPGKNKQGRPQKTYFLSRRTFNLICIRSPKPRANQCAEYFATVYDIALEYVQKLRAKNIKNETEIKPKIEKVEKRVDDLVKQRIDKYKTIKLEKELAELKNKVKELENIIIEKNKAIEEKEKYWNSAINRGNLLFSENRELKYKLDNLEKQNTSNNNKTNIVPKKIVSPTVNKLVPKLVSPIVNNSIISNIDSNKEDNILENKYSTLLNKILITHLKALCKELGGIIGYASFKKEQKKELEKLIIKRMISKEEYGVKVIKYLTIKNMI